MTRSSGSTPAILAGIGVVAFLLMVLGSLAPAGEKSEAGRTPDRPIAVVDVEQSPTVDAGLEIAPPTEDTPTIEALDEAGGAPGSP